MLFIVINSDNNYHRLNGPAITTYNYLNGLIDTEEWYYKGDRHRDHAPVRTITKNIRRRGTTIVYFIDPMVLLKLNIFQMTTSDTSDGCAMDLYFEWILIQILSSTTKMAPLNSKCGCENTNSVIIVVLIS